MNILIFKFSEAYLPIKMKGDMSMEIQNNKKKLNKFS